MTPEPINQPDAAAGAAAHARIACALAFGVVAYLTLKPFVTRMPVSIQELLGAAFTYDRETLQHVVPAAVLTLLVQAGWGVRRIPAAVLVLAALCVLEVTQLFLEYRHGRLGDVAAQIIGVTLGAALPVPAVTVRAWRRVWMVLLVGWGALSITLGIRAQFGHTLGPMGTGYRLVVGDEHEGGRPWLGQVHGFAIQTDVSPEPVVEFGPPPTDGPWSSRAGLSIDLHRAHAGWSSLEDVSALCDALDDGTMIDVTIDATPFQTRQLGPARLVTVSEGMSNRNLTIGQEGDALVLRVRTRTSGLNAARPQFVFPGVFRSLERTSLHVRTDGGSAELWVGGVRVARHVSFKTPRDWLRLAPILGDAAGVIALFMPLGVAMAALGITGIPSRRSALGPAVWIAAAAVPIVILAVIWTTSLMLDRPVSWPLLPSAVGASIVGVAVVMMLRGQR